MDDKEHRERMDREYKINYVDLASKKEQSGRVSTRGTRGERKTVTNQNDTLQVPEKQPSKSQNQAANQ